MTLSYPLTWLEINTQAISYNIKEIRKSLSRQTKFMAVIKADAYGHGLITVGKAIEKNCDYLAVFDFKDAVTLRKNGVKSSLLVLGPTPYECLYEVLKHNIEITISNLEALKKIIAFESIKKIPIHLCADTGMGRDGFVLSDLPQVLQLLQKHKSLNIKGFYAHFSAADEEQFETHTQKQLSEFSKWQQALMQVGINPIFHHSASAGSLRGLSFDMVRAGIAIYGLWPSLEMRDELRNHVKLKAALSWKARIVEIRNLPKGSPISYGCTHKLKRDSRLAVLAIGYYDGLPRAASNKAQFLVKGKKVAQLGRITMNMTVLDVTDVKSLKVGDAVTVIGAEGKNQITAEDWGGWAGTINYEITTRINSNMLRIEV